ncbi:hypothetical protein JQ617_32280 [Bradyrhizobium sp. KB893862 SZCCT0404]|nr:hypothetical protein [Bradyrhizobium sp. KB893862 SZCCT0404]MBR1178681.1 hypothetical protein [Bradyrhizobium sp. KB893862 SZCCT0404]
MTGTDGRPQQTRPPTAIDRMKPHREARIAGLSLAAVYAMCLLLTAISMS